MHFHHQGVAIGLIVVLCVFSALCCAMDFTAFGPLGQGGVVNGQTFNLNTAGYAHQLDAFLFVQGVDLNGEQYGVAAQLSSDTLPTGLDFSFSAQAVNDANVILTYSFINQTDAILSQTRFVFYLDAEIDETINTFFNEYGQCLQPDQVTLNRSFPDSWTIDEPGFLAGRVMDKILSGSLDNANQTDMTALEDVAMALGFDLDDLWPGDSATIRIMISDSDSHLPGPILIHQDREAGAATRITVSGQTELPA